MGVLGVTGLYHIWTPNFGFTENPSSKAFKRGDREPLGWNLGRWTIQKTGSIPSGPSGELEWEAETTLQKENLDQGRPDLAGSRPAPDIGCSRGRAALTDLRLLFRSYKREKKKKKSCKKETEVSGFAAVVLCSSQTLWTAT